MKGVESVKKNSHDDAHFNKLEAKVGKTCFNLKATNGQIKDTSEMYESAVLRDNGIEKVKKNEPDVTADYQS